MVQIKQVNVTYEGNSSYPVNIFEFTLENGNVVYVQGYEVINKPAANRRYIDATHGFGKKNNKATVRRYAKPFGDIIGFYKSNIVANPDEIEDGYRRNQAYIRNRNIHKLLTTLETANG